ncbi:MAG: hypothetical protein K2X98_06595 [Alphaproteobacteria bacterium]|nr:hypothetical protein [Alphaproteobacteria bacterium]
MLNTTLLSAAMAAILLTSSMTSPIMAMDGTPAHQDQEGKETSSKNIIQKEKGDLFIQMQKDFEAFKDKMRDNLSKLKGLDLTDEENQKAFSLAKQYNLETEASMFGD